MCLRVSLESLTASQIFGINNAVDSFPRWFRLIDLSTKHAGLRFSSLKEVKIDSLSLSNAFFLFIILLILENYLAAC